MSQYCEILMRCPACGAEFYRRPQFVPVESPCYKGEERMLPETCGAFPPRDPDVAAWLGLCRGTLETVPGFNHDLTLHNFDVDMETITDGRVKGTQRVSSLHEVRQIENESLRRHANGEGQPMVFRDLSQDHRNRHKHTLTDTPYEKHRSLPRDQVLNPTTHAGGITVKRVDADKVGA